MYLLKLWKSRIPLCLVALNALNGQNGALTLVFLGGGLALLDGAPLATLMFGQQATATVAPGRHALRAYNTLVWKTIEFDVVEDQDVTFQIVNRPGRFTYILVTLLGVGPIYVDIERA